MLLRFLVLYCLPSPETVIGKWMTHAWMPEWVCTWAVRYESWHKSKAQQVAGWLLALAREWNPAFRKLVDRMQVHTRAKGQPVLSVRPEKKRLNN